jgi:hypothetical protein
VTAYRVRRIAKIPRDAFGFVVSADVVAWAGCVRLLAVAGVRADRRRFFHLTPDSKERIMRIARCSAALLVPCALLLAGCSGSSAGWTAFSVGKNLSKKDSYLRIFLDGQEAQQNKLKKGLSGYSPWTVREAVSTSPKFKYEIIDPKKFGDIFNVSMQVHQKFQADFSDQADYIITSAALNDRSAQMKPGMEYDLANMGPGFKILNKERQEVSTVKFVPGVEYLLVFTVQADKSETVQVLFETK